MTVTRHDRPDEPSTNRNRDRLFDVTVVRDVRIPSVEPGDSLAATLILPKGAGRVPALLAVYPYLKDSGFGAAYEVDLRWFAARGYACVLVDFRGTGSSDGMQRAAFDRDEAEDALTTIDWAASQRWCNGSVGMWGISYGSIMTMRTAARNPPHLKAILALEGMTDPELEFINPDGNAGCLGPTMWAGQMLFLQLLPAFEGYGTPEQTTRWQRRQNELEPWSLDLARYRPGDPALRSRSFDTSQINVPAFCFAGWRDLFRDSAIRGYQGITAPKKLIVGPWMHSFPHLAARDSIDFRTLALEWWDHWLRGVDNEAMKGPLVTLGFEGNPTTWRRFESWPPAQDTVRLEGQGSGALVRSDARGKGIAVPFRSSPLTGALSGLSGLPVPGFGLPLDQHQDDLLGTVFSSEPFEEDMLIAGTPTIVVRFSDDSTPQRLVAHLTDVDSEGRSKLIALGTLADMNPATGYQISLGATGYLLLAGHRIRIVISDSEFPRLWPISPFKGALLDGVTLELPTLPTGAGTATDFPTPELDPAFSLLGGSFEPTWTIRQDLISGGLEVEVGWRGTSMTSNREHEMELMQSTTAQVTSADPASGFVQGRYAGSIRMKNGDIIKVTVNIHRTASSVVAQGEIRKGDELIFSRKWSA